MPEARVKYTDAGVDGRGLARTSALSEPALAAPNDGEVSDEALFQRVREGDRDSLGQLVERHQERLFGLLVQLTGGDANRADDLFQETFLRAVRSAETFDASKSFRPWLTTIAVNLVRDDARRRKLQNEVAVQAAETRGRGARMVAPQEMPDEQAERGDEAVKVRAALQRLTEKEREVVLLHFYERLTLAEAADVLAVPLGTVKSRLHGALERLRGLLEA